MPSAPSAIVGRHHARQAHSGSRRPSPDEVVLAEHVVEVEPGAGHDHAGPRSGRGRDGGRVAVRVDHRDVRRPAGGRLLRLAVQVSLDPPVCRPKRFRCEEPTREPSAMEISHEPGAPGAALLAHHLGERSDCLGAARGRVRETLEEREPVRDQNPAGRRWRVREHGVAPKDDVQWPPPDDAVGGKIVHRQLAAALADRLDHRTSPLSTVERGRSRARDRLEGGGQVWQAQGVTGDEPRARRAAVDPSGLVAVPEDRIEHRVHVRLRPRELDAVAGKLRGRCE